MRIWPGEVWVRRQTPGATQSVSDSAFAGMVVGRVQRREVVVLELDLGPLGDAIAEPDEDVLDRPLGLREQVGDAARDGQAGQRDVDGVLGEAPLELGRRELGLARGVLGLEPLAHAVQRRAAWAALARLERRDAAQRERHRRGAAEHGHARGLELVARLRVCEGAPPLLLEPFDVVHAHSAPRRRDEAGAAPAVPPCLPPPSGCDPSLRAETVSVPDRLGG